MRILVKKGEQRMWVSNSKKIKFWEAVASRLGILADRLGSGVGNVTILKRVR